MTEASESYVRQWTPENREARRVIVKELYPTHDAFEVARELKKRGYGVSMQTVEKDIAKVAKEARAATEEGCPPARPSPGPASRKAPIKGLDPSLVMHCFHFAKGTGKCRFLASAEEDCLGYPCANWSSFSPELASRYGVSAPITIFDIAAARDKRRDKGRRAGE